MLSIAIIFPLVFAIRGSFRRREKAIEHLSRFRAVLKTVQNFVICDNQLTEESKNEMYAILEDISEQTVEHLRNNYESTKDLDAIIQKVQQFILAHEANIQGRTRDRIFRFMKDLHESFENVHAINTHRTPISLKAYCKIFIYIFPLIYAPAVINTIGPETMPFIGYFVVVLTEFILIALYNIQDQLEYPFDDYGLDDINLNLFRINR